MEEIEEPTYSVFPFSKERLKQPELMGNSFQADYILRYLEDSENNVKSCIMEPKYIDKDFIVDYQMFHCRSFENINRITKRIHFFKNDILREDLQHALENNNDEFFIKLNNNYLGFVIIKPLIGEDNEPIIGRSLIKPYPEIGFRHFVKGKYSSSLFGVKLDIESLPFQSKDERVSACATIALWSALNPLREAFEIPRHSPAEITEIACTSPDDARKFPSTGLNLEQMINYIRRIGLDVEILNLSNAKNDTRVQIFIRTYIDADLPIIAALKLRKKFDYCGKEVSLDTGHAVVISGYRLDEHRKLKILFVHDDVWGPYLRVAPIDHNFLKWDYEWARARGYEVILDKLLVPVYPKIRTTFSRMHSAFAKSNKETESKLGSVCHCELSLKNVQNYKNSLLKDPIKGKMKILTMHLPRFLWIIRLFENDEPIGDGVYDGTSVYVKQLTDCEFDKH